MGAAFISYRRSDTTGEAGRLADALEAVLGRERVFRDVGGIDPGQRFDAALDAALRSASHVLVLIGPGWLAELQRRLPLADTDFVRLEVARALAAGKTVMPLLLRGASPPDKADLPDDLVGLSRWQAVALRDDTWAHDIGKLLDAIGRPYRAGLLALRALLAVPAIAGIGTVVARAANLDFDTTRLTLLGGLLVYAGIECGLWWRHRQGRQRQAPSSQT